MSHRRDICRVTLKQSDGLLRLNLFHLTCQIGNSHDCRHQCYPAAPAEADRSSASLLQHCLFRDPPHRLSQSVWKWDSSAGQHVPHFSQTGGQPDTRTGKDLTKIRKTSPPTFLLSVHNYILVSFAVVYIYRIFQTLL